MAHNFYQIVPNRREQSWDLWCNDDCFCGSFTNLDEARDERDRLESQDEDSEETL